MYDEAAALRALEALLWEHGPTCPHCGQRRAGRLNGASTPIGSWKCYSCRRQFTVRHRTIFQHSHVPLHIWLQALYLLIGTDFRISAQRLGRVLGISMRSSVMLKRKMAASLGPGVPDVSEASTPAVRVALIPEEQSPDGRPVGRQGGRYARFLEAAQPIGELQDRRFLTALHRLLGIDEPAMTGSPSHEEQLELRLFPEGDAAVTPEAPSSGTNPTTRGQHVG